MVRARGLQAHTMAGDSAAGAGAGGAQHAEHTRYITLEHGEHHDATLYRLRKGTRLQFRPGDSLMGRKLFLYTNYAHDEGAGEGDEPRGFVRSQYHALCWRGLGGGEAEAGAGAGDGLLVDGADVCAELTLRRPGPYHYYFVYDSKDCPLGPQGSGWFQVSPRLPVPLDAVTCQTVLAKCLGPLARWRAALRPAREAGYNALHFTPLQALGASRSAYSIADQLRLDPRAGEGATFAAVGELLGELRADWGVLSVSDVVLNHTANETPWLREHPEAAYNCRDCAHLRPAALLDAVLARLSADVARGLVPGAPDHITHHDHIEAVVREAERRVEAVRLHEMFQCDVAAVVREFTARAANRVAGAGGDAGALQLVPDPQRRRLAATVDLELALRLYNTRGAEDEAGRVSRAAGELSRALHVLNAAAAGDAAGHVRAALDNCRAGLAYHRLQADGPRTARVTDQDPLVPRYFTFPLELSSASAAEVEACVWGAGGAGVMAHNGWVMEADPLQDFASREAGGRVYLRRELLAWGDSVKLRYGLSPEESPFLWAHMRQYVELTARLFDGLRLDNCHSTPLHVAEYMLDCARRVRPDLYVVAELFTNSDHVDNIYVNRLGITSLIREALSAWDAHEQGRLVYRYGGRPVGAFLRPALAPARPRVAHAMLMDLTHDNRSPVAARTALDLLPSAALVAMACCATGSTRGYDELVPHQVHVVDEERLYCEWDEAGGEGRVGPHTGIVAAKRALNDLHAELALGGYSEVFVDQMDEDVVAVTRHDPATRRSLVLVAATAFRARPPGAPAPRAHVLRFEGELRDVALEATVAGDPGAPHAPHARYITGLAGYECDVRRDLPRDRSRLVAAVRLEGDRTALELRPLAPGTVLAVRVSPRPPAAAALALLRPLAAAGPRADPLRLRAALAPLDLGDLNALLYRCEAEERDATGGEAGAYDVPGHGPLAYAGLQGAASLLERVRAADDLGHALCANLRAGDWLAEYTWRRLEREPRLAAAAERCRAALEPVLALPRFLRPAYFELVHRLLHGAARAEALARLPAWCRGGSLARGLALASVQLAGRVPSAALPLGSGAPAAERALTLSAGLPHFAAGYMRCWGRDTFVALRGTLLLAGRHAEARAHVLAFAACLRHGLVPNLLDGGARARYNCRDAVWWWLLAVRQCCEEAPGGPSAALLEERVERLFPTDDAPPAEGAARPAQPLHAVVQEALEAHFEGRAFRERGAGRDLDAHMTERGFHVQVGVHPDTGFPFGGNEANCGTWMDKMGSSERAGTRGRPATPRDGSAVELVALCHAAVSWLAARHAAGEYPRAGVARPGAEWTWRQWAERLRDNFERHFWVPAAPSAADARPDLVHRRAIYKDSHGASQPWADYQLRCNYAVAMAVAPELFDARHAWLALDQCERHLLAPLGLRTLDPADWNYRAAYRNSDDSADAAVAHGFNYHQGPAWLWPLGFYLRARLAFAHAAGQHARTVAAVLRALGPLAAELRASEWRGLPELADGDGAPCADSCRTQAWSSAAALEALHALHAARHATRLD